ncbi:hypothetical protein FJ365_04770 [Candidatus Dependentiae bacterium]|nr:hypothetical protein [Candidatus Dependentiae bacterium]
MQIKQFVMFLTLLVVTNLSASQDAAMIPSSKIAVPVVLNTVSPKPWDCSSNISFDYSHQVSALQRIESGLIGFSQLAISLPALPFLPMLAMTTDSVQSRYDATFAMTGIYGILLVEIRMLAGGLLNMYNAIVPEGWEYKIRSRSRWMLGITELVVAGAHVALAGYGMLFGGLSSCNQNRRSDHLSLLAFPGCWGMGLCGLYDLSMAQNDMRNGLSLVRF